MGDFCGSFVNRENRSLFSKVRPLLAQVWDLPSTLNCKISISLDIFWKLAFMVTEAKNSLLGSQYSLLALKLCIGASKSGGRRLSLLESTKENNVFELIEENTFLKLRFHDNVQERVLQETKFNLIHHIPCCISVAVFLN